MSHMIPTLSPEKYAAAHTHVATVAAVVYSTSTEQATAHRTGKVGIEKVAAAPKPCCHPFVRRIDGITGDEATVWTAPEDVTVECIDCGVTRPNPERHAVAEYVAAENFGA